jgi:hypothetical protein
MNNKGFQPISIVIAVLLGSMVIGILYVMSGELITDYGTEGIINPSFTERYDKLEESKADAQEIFEKVNEEGGLNILDLGEVVLSSTTAVAKIILGIPLIITSQLTGLGEDFGIPSAITAIVLITLVIIISIIIIGGILNAINKTDKL